MTDLKDTGECVGRVEGATCSGQGRVAANPLRLESGRVCTAITRSLQTGLVPSKAILHSERGCQFTSSPVRELFHKANLRQSMSAKGYCYDNAFAESCFTSLKAELLPDAGIFESHLHARRAIFDYLETFYNRSRGHSLLNYLASKDFLHQFFQNQP